MFFLTFISFLYILDYVSKYIQLSKKDQYINFGLCKQSISMRKLIIFMESKTEHHLCEHNCMFREALKSGFYDLQAARFDHCLSLLQQLFSGKPLLSNLYSKKKNSFSNLMLLD